MIGDEIIAGVLLKLGFSQDELLSSASERTESPYCVTALEEWAKKEKEGGTYLQLAQALHSSGQHHLIEAICKLLSSVVNPLSLGEPMFAVMYWLRDPRS